MNGRVKDLAGVLVEEQVGEEVDCLRGVALAGGVPYSKKNLGSTIELETLFNVGIEGLAAMETEDLGTDVTNMSSQDVRTDLNVHGKRAAADALSVPTKNNLAIVPVNKAGSVVAQLKNNVEEGLESEVTDPSTASTPQKNENRKKLRGEDGIVIPQTK